MKRLLQIFTCAVLMIAAMGCTKGVSALDKAYQQSCDREEPEKVAITLCDGDIDCATLTTDEAMKLGAILTYITYAGLYSSDFEAQVDMHQFGKLLNGYREREKEFTQQEQNEVMEITRQILVAGQDK